MHALNIRIQLFHDDRHCRQINIDAEWPQCDQGGEQRQ